MELRISRVIQGCTVCKHEGEEFSHGQGKKYKTDFNTDVLVRREPVRNDFYFIELFSLECLHTGYITARYVNRRKYESKYEMINKVVTEYWVYGEYGDGFGTPRNAFCTAEEADDICHLRQAGRLENLKWGRSDLKLGKFKFPEFLDCKHAPKTTDLDLQMRLSEQVFVHNNTLGPGIGYTPHQLVLGIGLGIYQVSESESSKFAHQLVLGQVQVFTKYREWKLKVRSEPEEN